MDIDYDSSKTLSIGDLKARIAYLVERGAETEPEDEDDGNAWDEHEELKALRDVESDLSWCWKEDNTTLVGEGHWEDFCRQTCYDLGECRSDGIVDFAVDWEKVANSMAQDYKIVTLPNHNDFYVRG